MNQPAAPSSRPKGDVERPELNDEQQKAVIRATSEIVQAAVLNRRPVFSEAALAGAAELPVFGCFVSIKRNKRLRGCCGYLGQRMPLIRALIDSATTSATGDVRMPSVSLTELPFLEFEIWLLYGQQAVTSRGADRIDDVVIGKHGLQIQRGESRGLLLPGVAEEHGLHAEGFLQQVCIKAGLAPTDWKENDVQLATFEGNMIAGRFDPALLVGEQQSWQPMFTARDIQQLVSWCSQNISAVCRGAVPTYYLAGVGDGSVQGINLEIKVGRADPLQLGRMSLRHTAPLQATLYQMCETAGKQLEAEGLRRLQPEEIAVGLSLLYEPAMHGTVADPDLNGFDPTRRALMVNQSPKSAWVFDPAKTGPQLLELACDQSRITQTDSASITSFVVETNVIPTSVVNIPRPAAGHKLRPPAVAGMFYPADPAQLHAVVDDLIPKDKVDQRRWRAALVPHAGLMFSGRIAADVLRRIEFPSTIIVIGPKHTSLGVEWAVAPHEAWQMPGGAIPADPELAQRLCDAIDGLELDAVAHYREHAIEAELPFLAKLAPDSKVVGIAIGQANLERCQSFAQGLATVVADKIDDTLLVISSDMNHYASDAETRRVDELAISALEGLDPSHLFHTVRENNISMCGMLPACMILESLKCMNRLTRAERVNYGTSGDVSGDKSRVVGYAGMLFE